MVHYYDTVMIMITGIIEQKHSSHFIERIGRFDPWIFFSYYKT